MYFVQKESFDDSTCNLEKDQILSYNYGIE